MFTFTTVLFGVLIRLLPHIPNFVPITATALFGGTYLKKRYAIIIPLLTIALSDYLLLYVRPFEYPLFDFHKLYPITAMFHYTTPYVWGSFVISGLIGLLLRKRTSILTVSGATVLCSLQFFLITNFGVWAAGAYSRGIDGLIQSYVMGLPFLKWTLMGDLFYTGVFFGAFEFKSLVAKRFFLLRG